MKVLTQKQKIAEVKKQLRQMYKDEIQKTWNNMAEKALRSGVLDPEGDFFLQDHYLLAKAVLTIWGRQEHFAPTHSPYLKEIKNLEHFI